MISKISARTIINNKAAQNGLWLYALQFFNLVVPLLTLPYITRVLGSDVFGVFSIAINIVSYLQVVMEYGFAMSGTRKVVLQGRTNLEKTFTSIVVCRVFLLLLCLITSFVYVLLNKENVQLCMSFSILLICLVGICLQMNWLFQGMQDMKYISIVNICGRSISTILIFILVKDSSDLLLYSLLYSISPFISGFVGLCIAKKKYQLTFVRVKTEDVLIELREGFFVFTTQLSAKVFGAIGITFLGLISTNSVVGIYSAIQRIPNILILLWMPISQVVYPLSSQHFAISFKEGKHFIDKVKRIVLPSFFILALFIAVLSKFIVGLLFGGEYAVFYYWLLPLLLWLIVAIDNNFLGIQTLLGSGHDKEYGEAFQIGVAITIIVNYLLIKFYGGFGASFAPLISEIALNYLLRRKIRLVSNECSISGC